MATEKIVRCLVSREDTSPTEPTTRYVPLDIFELWKFLMENRHGFSVDRRVTSLWFERGAATRSSYAGIDFEAVTQVELFFFSEEDGMLHQQVRYFPSGDPDVYRRIRDVFVSHYRRAGGHAEEMPKLSETPGVWVRR
ncbi:MAG: hypothetical protein JW958_14765 [Candidatus Eisenbacteria bacterium]|nr:hypothetical protein [Candidatus Eisenbacteria bacterium]